MEFLNLIPIQKRRAFLQLILALFILWLIFMVSLYFIIYSFSGEAGTPTLLSAGLISSGLIIAALILSHRYYLPRPGIKLLQIMPGRIILEKDPALLLTVEKGVATLKKMKTAPSGSSHIYKIDWRNREESYDINGSSRVELTFDVQPQEVDYKKYVLYDEEALTFPALRLKTGKKSEIWIAFSSPTPIVFLTHYRTSFTWGVLFKKLKKQARH